MHTDNTPFSKSPQQENSTSSGGTVVAFDRSNRPEEKEEYAAAIRMWCVDRSLSNALTRQELGAMQGFDRVDAQRKAFLLGMSAFFRDNSRADVVMGVYSIIMFLSDNNRGMCTMSQGRMAEILHRTRATISDAMRRLREAGLILSDNGKAGATPIIPKAVCGNYNHVVWLMDAIATCPLQPTGQERLEPARSSRQVGVAVKEPVNYSRQVTCPLQPAEPVGCSGHNFTKENSLEERGPREGAFGKVAAAVGLTMAASVMPLAAAPHPVEQVVQGPAECWLSAKAVMAAAMSKQEADAQKQVWMTPTGGLEIAGAFKAEMSKMFPLVDMTSALAAACVNVKVDSGAWNALQVVRRTFGYMQQDALSKQARAASYGKKPPASLGEKPAGMPQKIWDEIQAGKKC